MAVFHWLDCHKLRQTQWNGIIKNSFWVLGGDTWLIPKSSVYGHLRPCAQVDHELRGEATTHDECIKQMFSGPTFCFSSLASHLNMHYIMHTASMHTGPLTWWRKKSKGGRGVKVQTHKPSLRPWHCICPLLQHISPRSNLHVVLNTSLTLPVGSRPNKAASFTSNKHQPA